MHQTATTSTARQATALSITASLGSLFLPFIGPIDQSVWAAATIQPWSAATALRNVHGGLPDASG